MKPWWAAGAAAWRARSADRIAVGGVKDRAMGTDMTLAGAERFRGSFLLAPTVRMRGENFWRRFERGKDVG